MEKIKGDEVKITVTGKVASSSYTYLIESELQEGMIVEFLLEKYKLSKTRFGFTGHKVLKNGISKKQIILIYDNIVEKRRVKG